MTRTFLRATKSAMLSVGVLLALSLTSLPASAQADYDKSRTISGSLAVLLLSGPSFPKGPKGLATKKRPQRSGAGQSLQTARILREE
jgi:hypothetical protein